MLFGFVVVAVVVVDVVFDQHSVVVVVLVVVDQIAVVDSENVSQDFDQLYDDFCLSLSMDPVGIEFAADENIKRQNRAYSAEWKRKKRRILSERMIFQLLIDCSQRLSAKKKIALFLFLATLLLAKQN